MKAQLKIASIILIFALIYIYLYLRLKLPLSSSNSGKSFNLKSRIIESFKNYSFGIEPEIKKNSEKKHPTLFCFIKTHPGNFDSRVKVAYENCFKHCTDHRFVTIFDNKTKNLPYKFLHPTNWLREDYGKLTNKVYNGFMDVRKLNSTQLFDWYMLADDDTFVHVKNLFKFLQNKDPSIPKQYGHHYGAIGGFLSGGAGYVFSREAFIRVTDKLIKNMSLCQNTGIDDLDFSKCLQSVNATIGDSRDENGYERFHPGDFEHHFFGPVDVGYPEHKQFIGPQCCAKDWITFHERNHNHFDRLIEFMDLILK